MGKAKGRFKVDEKRWLRISQALQKDNKIAELWHSGDCPLCGTKAEDDYVPFVVDNDRLHFIAKCCGVIQNIEGGPMSYVMLTRKCTHKEAVEFLEKFTS